MHIVGGCCGGPCRREWCSLLLASTKYQPCSVPDPARDAEGTSLHAVCMPALTAVVVDGNTGGFAADH